MELSLFLGRLFGLYFLLVAAIWLVRKNQFEAGVRDLISSNGLLALSGAIQTLIGLAILVSHFVWGANWRILITLLGVFALIQGVLRIAFPQEVRNFVHSSFEKGYWVYLAGLFIIGAILTYHGFHGS